MPTRKSQIPDAIFPSTELGIPRLDLSFCASWVEAPIRAWGSVSRKAGMRGTWHFYVDDYKFSTVFSDPSTVTASKAVAFIEPNYTLGDHLPYPLALYRVYKKRWVSRFLQNLGLFTFVDLFAPPQWEELNLEGVPVGWRAFASCASDSRIGELERQYATALRFHSDPLFLVYGGGKKVADFTAGIPNAVHVRHPANEFRKAAVTEGKNG